MKTRTHPVLLRCAAAIYFCLALSPAGLDKASAQVLIYRNASKEFRVYAKQRLKVVLYDGRSFSGTVDSVSAQNIVIAHGDNGQSRVAVETVKTYIFRRHLWYLGPCASLIRLSFKYNTSDYHYRFEQ